MPIEAISRQRDLNVISKTLGVNSLHSPSLKTARKQSMVLFVPASIEGEEQLRATAYTQEHIKCHSSTSDDMPDVSLV